MQLSEQKIKEISSQLKFNADKTVISKIDDSFVLIEDLGKDKELNLNKIIAYTISKSEDEKIVQQIIGEMYYLIGTPHSIPSGFSTIISMNNQSPSVTKEMLKAIENIGIQNKQTSLTIMCADKSEAQIVSELGYILSPYVKSNSGCFPSTKPQIRYNEFNNDYIGLQGSVELANEKK